MMKALKRIGLLGGSFDPIHFGHLLAAQGAAERLRLDKVIFIPAMQPPHKMHRHLADFHQRYAMVKIAVRGNPLFDVSDVEYRRGGKSYSIDTILQLSEQYGPHTRLYFIIGADMLPDLPTWKDVHALIRLCSFAVAVRPGYDLAELDKLADRLGLDFVRETKRHILQIPSSGVSATDIRRRVRLGKPIHYMTPETVERYIRRHNLYQKKKRET